jgi:hypothetical protein
MGGGGGGTITLGGGDGTITGFGAGFGAQPATIAANMTIQARFLPKPNLLPKRPM